MSVYDPDKEYLINVMLKNSTMIPDIVMLGKDIENSVKDIFAKYPKIKKVIIYDNDTKEAVHIYKEP